MYLKAKGDCIGSVRMLWFKAFPVYGLSVLGLKNPYFCWC